MNLINFQQVSLNIAEKNLLNAVDWQIHKQHKIALVGRNGAGKSSLLKLIQGEILPDGGQILLHKGLRIASLAQEVPQDHINDTVYDFLVKGLGEAGELLREFKRLTLNENFAELAVCQQNIDQLQAWEILPRLEMIASKLGLNPDWPINKLSGGMKRRALLAAALIAAPDLLLLDEPTNHLDINTIEWLESYLQNYHGSLLVVTHDREFLNQVANQIVEIDRGKLKTYHCNYQTYLERKEANQIVEEKHNALFDKRLSKEETWIRQGVKARRTRNEGRVLALKKMREAYKARRLSLGKIQSQKLDVTRASTIIFEAKKINLTLADKRLLTDFSLLITRGDKLGIIGPNGCGKTTLIKLLLDELLPDSGEIKRGTSLDIAYFDQLRNQLDEQHTVKDNVANGAEHVTINGKTKHVASYLQEFLFAPTQFNQKVATLSGGEKNRLLLAKLFAKPVNLLIMDEPTNDLDIETLELLEDLLINYSGTLLLISHDRLFIDQVVTNVLIWEGEGHFNEYVGGYRDYCNLKKKHKEAVSIKPMKQDLNKSIKLNYQQQQELKHLPTQIERMETQINELQSQMAAPDFYQQNADLIVAANKQLAETEVKLAELFNRWEILEGKNKL